MKLRCALIASTALLLCAPAARAQTAADGPEQVVRDFMYALYANDTAGLEKQILPEAGSTALIGSQQLTPEQLDKLRKDVDRLTLRQVSPPTVDGTPVANASVPLPVGTKIIYSAAYRGVPLAIPVQRTESGWKVDVRYWLVMRKQRDVRPQLSDPEMVAKGFLFHVLAKKPEDLQQFASERIKGDDFTAANNLPPGDLDQVLSLCLEMPIVRARTGERVQLPSGEVAVGAERPDSMLLIGLMGFTEIPFVLKRVEGAWKVVPQRYFEILRKAGAI